MKSRSTSLLVALAAAACVLPSACVQYPTERHGVVDLRPTIAFRVAATDPTRLEARISIDGLDAGRVGDFVEGVAAMRVLAGTHVVRVTANGASLLDERIYLADGVHRTLALP